MKNFSSAVSRALAAVGFFAGTCGLNAQDTAYSELGLNATAFVNQYLDFGNDDDDFMSPFVLTYDQFFGGFGARIGLGLFTSSANQVPDDDNGNTSLRVTTANFNGRLGAWKQKNLGEKWTIRGGIDLVYQHQMDASKTISTDFFGQEVTTEVETNTRMTGAGPFVFVQFHLSPTVSLGTEMTAYFLTGKEKFTSTNSQFPEFDDEDVSELYQFDLGAPTALFFSVRF